MSASILRSQCWASSCSPSSHKDLRPGCITEVFFARRKLFDKDSFKKTTFDFLFREVEKNHHSLSLLPINWGGNWLCCCQPERVTRRISSKFLLVVAGKRIDSFSFVSGPKTNTTQAITGMSLSSFFAGSNMPQRMAKVPLLIIDDGKW